ncbi:MAG: hypothetical protein KME31_03980 [Tolypothrix carrinoi HA7290-LM1]|jgi:hypothetical protein|nr:hypothetical protein [Tolypothrix carrinoi HA7290-LM1]
MVASPNYNKKDFIRTSRTFSCPACSGQKHDCQVKSDFSMVLCLHTHQSIPGWRYLKDVNGGAFWGILVAERSDGSHYSSQHPEWREEKERRRREEKAAEAKSKLSIQEIDKYARQLHKYFGLSSRHRDSLRARGLSDEQINLSGFFSVSPREKLPALFPSNYPGVRSGSLAVADSAIFMPAFTLEGLIAGGQYRLDGSPDGGKYRWPKGYKSSHLQNGELPITIIPGFAIFSSDCSWTGEEFGGEAFVAEGLPKPLIAAIHFNKLFVGAAGGNFSGSGEQFQELITTKIIHTINICPDAGDVKNPQVMRRWIRQYEFFHSLGLFVRVGWWGQIDKEQHQDIDELPLFTEIDYISWQQFLAYAREHGGLQSEDNWFDSKQLNFGDYKERVQAAQQYLEDFSPWADSIKSERFLNLNLNNLAKGVYLLKSGMATGKSTLALKIVEHFSQGTVLSYRNSLLQQFCEKSQDKVIHLHDISTDDKRLNKKLRSVCSWIAACVDSCFLLSSRKVLILEEVDKLLQQMLAGSTCRKRRKIIIESFVRLIREADYIFCFDADLTAISSKYLQEISGKNIFGIWNKGQVPAWKVSVYGGEKKVFKSGKVREMKNARGGFEKGLVYDAALGNKLLIVSDAQRNLVGLQSVLESFNLDVLRVDSMTKADPETSHAVNSFLQKPNEYLAENKPQVVLISPTAESSLDITLPYFERVYGTFFGVINHRQIMQMLARYRQPVERIVFCKTYSLLDNHASRSPLPEVVARNYFNNHQQAIDLLGICNYLPDKNEATSIIDNLEQLMNFTSNKWQSPHFKAVCSYTALDNHSRANLRESLIRDLQNIGHNASEMPMQVYESFKKINEARDEWLKEESSSIYEAEDISYQQALKLWESMMLTPEDRHKATKAILKHRLPGFDFDADFIYEKHFKDPDYISQLELRWAMSNLDKQKMFDVERWLKSLNYGDEIWDMRSRAMQASVLCDLGVPSLVDKLSRKLGHWTADEELIVDFKRVCVKNSYKLRAVLAINADADSDPVYLLRRVLSKIGVVIVRDRHRVGGGERKYFYHFDPTTLPQLDDTTRFVLEAIDKRFFEPPKLSPTSQRYKKYYISSQSGTVFVPDLDPLENPHLVNKLIKVEPAVDKEQLEEIRLNRDSQQIVEFELSMPEILCGCDSWELVVDFLELYELQERQVAWALLSQSERERLAFLNKRGKD